jgi:D-glycero-alpha-D-manno-heptose-7-phosphate kinase
VADIPARAGLGSSSSFTVGLLHALHAYQGEYVSAETLAQEACKIEIDMLQEPVGKQDQYIAAYGGLQHIQFNSDESVFVDPLICPPERKQALGARLMLFHCGGNRSAGDVLKGQQQNIPRRLPDLARMADLARQCRDELRCGKDFRRIGEILHEGWMLKRTMSADISSPAIDHWYETARNAGALGGKLLGAGGGGFLLCFVEPEHRPAVAAALHDLRLVPFELEPQGSKIIYVT